MKKLIKTLLLVGVLFIVGSSTQSVYADTDIYQDNPLVAEHMHVQADVKENGIVTFNYQLDMDFRTPHQGVFINIPEKYEMTIDGVERHITFPVRNIDVKNADFEVSDESEGKTVRIGTPGVFITGKTHYNYSYDVIMRDLDLEGDLFYFNLVGKWFQFPILTSSFEINMPKPFEGRPYFYATMENRPVQYKVEGSKISGSFDEPLNQQALTIELALPKGYFSYINFDYTLFGLLGSGLIFGILAVIAMRKGRAEKPVEVVSFVSPQGLSSAEIGYVMRKYSKKEDILSLIIYWAHRGYLTVEETEGKSKSMILHRTDKPFESPNEEELRLFNAFFLTGNDADLSSEAVMKNVREPFQFTQSNLKNRFKHNASMRVFDTKINKKRYGMEALLALAYALFSGLWAFAAFYSIFAGLFVGFIVFVIVFMALELVTLVIDPETKMNASGVLAYLLFGLGLFLFGAGMSIKVSPIHVLIESIIIFIGAIVITRMQARTPQGRKWLGEILGLKRFIEVAEKHRIEALAMQTPEIFFEVLPYAYTLGISNTWIKQFEGLHLDSPDWYQSNNPNTVFTPSLFWMSMNSRMHTVNTSVAPITVSSKGSGGFNSGGGFGGGGGGGFSGGGFGGGGGGGW